MVSRTKIKYICLHDQIELLNELFENPNFDPSANNNEAIKIASRKGNLSIVNRLLQDPRVDPSANDNEAVMEAMRRNRDEVVIRLFADSRVDPSANSNFAIRWAVYRDNIELFNQLVDDPRVNPYDCDYESVKIAIRNGNETIINRLVPRLLEDPNVNRNTLLDAAVYYKRLDYVNQLLEMNIVFDIDRAIGIAREVRNNKDIVSRLEDWRRAMDVV